MEREKTIFSNVVNSENIMTELFYNLLVYKPFRDAFLELFLSKDELIYFEYDHFETQYNLINNLGRPDLIISNEKYEIFFEIKIDDIELQNSQPKSYLEYLCRESGVPNKLLILLVPKNYKFKNEWKLRIEKFDNEHQEKKVNTLFCFWEDVIEIIERYNLNMLSQIFSEFLELLKMWYDPKTITFNYKEVTHMFLDEIPKITINLYKVVDKVAEQLGKLYNISTSKGSKGYPEYSIYIKDKDGMVILYFGVWYDFWFKYKKPLCYGVNIKKYPSDVTNKFLKIHGNNIIKEDKWKLAWIDRDIIEGTFEGEEDCSEKILHIIKDELSQLIE